MKWVFDNTQHYEIEGDYKDVWVEGERLTFDEIKARARRSIFSLGAL